jgi:hypothetical protein
MSDMYGCCIFVNVWLVSYSGTSVPIDFTPAFLRVSACIKGRYCAIRFHIKPRLNVLADRAYDSCLHCHISDVSMPRLEVC